MREEASLSTQRNETPLGGFPRGLSFLSGFQMKSLEEEENNQKVVEKKREPLFF